VKLRRTELKRARIEIIPMIDTIFFLLVFFMITSLSMTQMSSKKVNLPESSTAAEKPFDKVVLTITREGEYYIDRDRVQPAQIKDVLALKLSQNKDMAVVLNCDRDQHVTDFIKAFDLVKQANAGKVMIATSPRTVGELYK
jgi:biopolymer transport protein ExbD